jgi:hypothetical protein
MLANLPTHAASVGKTAVGLDVVTSALAASWCISEIDGTGYVALDSGPVGSGVLAGTTPNVQTDSSIRWLAWQGFITAQPQGPS